MDAVTRPGSLNRFTSHPGEDKEEFDEEEGWCEHYSVTEIFPDELLFAIFSFVGWRDLIHIAQTCTKMHTFCSDLRLWLQLWDLDFSRCITASFQRVLEITKRCPNARVLRLDVSLNDEQFVEILAVCPRLHTFQMKNVGKLGNASLRRIASECDDVKAVKVSGSTFAGTSGVEEVVNAHAKTLEELYLNRCYNVRYLRLTRHQQGKLERLAKITIKNMKFEEESVRTLCANCPSVEELCLAGSTLAQFTMEEVADGLTELKMLDLTGCDLLESVQLQNLVDLKIICCQNCTALEEFTAECSNLTSVLLSNCSSLKKFTCISKEISSLDLSALPRLDSLSFNCSKLTELNVAASSRMPVAVLESLIQQHSGLETLNIRSCKQFSKEDLERLVSMMQSVTTLYCGGMTLTDFTYSSQCITSLSLESVVDLPFVSFLSPSLCQLILHNCSDINEEQLIEGILYGSSVKKTSSHSPVKSAVSPNLGAPNLVDLRISHVPNVSGKALSLLGGNITSLCKLTVTDSFFFKELRVNGWSSLETLEIIAATRFNFLDVQHCPNLKQISVLYCSDVSEVNINCESLEVFYTDGSSFSNLHLTSDQLTSLELDSIMASAASTLEVNCPNLHQLRVTRCRELGNERMSEITRNCSRLCELTVEGSNRLTSIVIPVTVTFLELNGLRRLSDVVLHSESQITVLHLCSLPKLSLQTRHDILQLASSHMKELKISGLARVSEMMLAFDRVESLLVEQVLNMTQLTVSCPKLHILSLLGCPHLSTLTLKVEKLHQLKVTSRSVAIHSLRTLHLVSNSARFLSRILELYCPRLVELTLTGAVVSVARLCGASHQLRFLKKIHLDKCTLETNGNYRVDGSGMFMIQRHESDVEFPSAPVEVSLSDTVVVDDAMEMDDQ